MCSSIQRFKEVIIRKSKWIFLESLKSRGVTKNQERDTQSPGHILLTCHQPDNKSLFRKWIKFSRLEDQVKKSRWIQWRYWIYVLGKLELKTRAKYFRCNIPCSAEKTLLASNFFTTIFSQSRILFLVLEVLQMWQS